MAINWQKDCKDTMWAMFWMGQDIPREHTRMDAEGLKRHVARLIRMTTQKTSGQRRKAEDVDWDALTPTLMNIAACATALCLSGALGDMPKEIEE